LQYHPKYVSERPWFEYIDAGLTDNGQRHWPYVSQQKYHNDIAEGHSCRQSLNYDVGTSEVRRYEVVASDNS
jgi:hypothetical protein